MKNYDSQHIKNVAILGHAGSGKTTFAEAMLFEAGVINRKGAIEDNNTASDYTDIEHERENSIFSTLLHAEWKDSKINIIDTPGFDDFIGEVISALKVVDTGVMLLNAQYGVEVGTETIWEYMEKFKIPTIFAVNQVDNDKADFDKTISQTKERFGRKIAVIQYPLNQGNGFNSIIDISKMSMYKFSPDGSKSEKLPIPDAEKEKAEKLHNELVESIAENDEKLMEKYFEKGTLDESDMQAGLKTAMINRELFPLFCLSAKHNIGCNTLIDFISSTAPAATERPAVKLKDGKELTCDSKGSPCLFVFKTISEANLGDMSFCKVYSGEVKIGTEFVNEETSATERINQLYFMQGKNRVSTDSLTAGDIGATVKLKKTHTNNTLHVKGNKLSIEPIEFPVPTTRTAVISSKTGEEEKLSIALNQIQEEDPSIIVEQSQELKQTLIHGQGELQLSLVKWRLDHRFNIQIDYVKPKIPYRETIQKKADSQYRHKKQSGGSGQFAEVYMRIAPYKEGMADPPEFNTRKKEEIDLDWGGKLVYVNCIVGGAIDGKFMPSILKGIMEKMHEGPLTGCYARDIVVYIYDGKMHPVDSNDISFKIAGIMAFKKAFMEADPKILEPIYEIEVLVPEEIMGEVMSDLQTRRSTILGMEGEGHYQNLKAKLPLVELHNYSSSLRSISQGRARYSMKFAEYSIVPFDIQQKLLAEHQEELQEA